MLRGVVSVKAAGLYRTAGDEVLLLLRSRSAFYDLRARFTQRLN